MARLNEFAEICKMVITEIYERYSKSSNDIEYLLAIDEKRRNYLLISNSWIDDSRFYGILIHMEVKEDGRVWLHEDNTDLIVVDWLLERGIPKNQIVLGWHAPSMRPDTEFAVN